MKRLLFASMAILVSCSGGTRAGKKAPGWFNQPPKHNNRVLYFVGDATGQADESTARELAINKAMNELSVYCGAVVKTDSVSIESEKNGEYSQEVSMTVDIAGQEITVREAVVAKVEVGASGGKHSAWVLMEWPKAQYAGVLAAQKQRASRALALFLEAEAAANENKVSEAQMKLKESRTVYGPTKAQIPIDHEKYHNSAILYDAMDALRQRLTKMAKERKKVMAVVVSCTLDGEKIKCPRDEYEGKVKEAVSGTGFKVSADTVSDTLANAILKSSSPKTDKTVRSSGVVVALGYEVESTAHESGVHYVHCSGRGALFDTDSNRIIQVKEAKRNKGAAPRKRLAIHFGCRKPAEALITWLEQELATLQ